MTKSKIPATLLAIISFSANSDYVSAQTADSWVCEPSNSGEWVCGVKQQTESIYGKPDLPFKRNARNRAILAKGIKSGAIVDPNTNHNLDWHYRNEIAADQLATLAPYCEGTYIEPINDSPTAGQIFDTAALAASANSSELQQDQLAKFSGDVYIAKGDMRAYADEAVVDQETEILTLSGNVVIRDNSLLMRGSTATINTTDSTGNIENAEYVLHAAHMRGEAAVIERESESIANLQQSYLTQCAPDSNAWAMKASKIVLNQETGMGTATHAVIKVKDVPIMYVPYITYPIDGKRRTGLLWPTLAVTNTDGPDIAIPLYLNIAPDWDATVTARSIHKRGLAKELEVRHLNDFSEWIVAGSHIDDELFNDKRWVTSIEEFGWFNQYWSHRIDYTRVSDDNFFTDLGVQSLSVSRRVQLKEEAELAFQNKNWRFETTLTQFQTLNPTDTSQDSDFNIIEETQTITTTVPEQYKMLPELNLEYRPSAKQFAFSGLLDAQFTDFDINDDNRTKGSRLYAAPGITYPMRWQGGFLIPTAKVRAVTYKLDDEYPVPIDGENQIGVTAPMFSLDGGLYFDRDSSWFGTNYIHSLEPRLYYLYSAFEEQDDQPLFDTKETTFNYSQLYRETRYAGYDRIDDSDQLSVGVTTRFVNAETGVEIFNASIGQVRYFKDREVTLRGNTPPAEEKYSDVAAELTWQPVKGFKHRMGMLYAPREKLVNKGTYNLTYKTNKNLIVNLGVSYNRKGERIDRKGELGDIGELADFTTRQSEFSTVLPITNNWTAYGKLAYDQTNSRMLEETFGLSYESCCWQVSMLYREGIDASNQIDRGFFLEFQLKGLGGSGNTINEILTDSIQGYQARDPYVH
jgi:LPS-assembly protein